jgi:hypothetical protein
MIFKKKMAKDVYLAQPGVKAAEITKILDARWIGMTDEEKKPYIRLAEQDKIRFDAAQKVV